MTCLGSEVCVLLPFESVVNDRSEEAQTFLEKSAYLRSLRAKICCYKAQYNDDNECDSTLYII